ncbi:MAG: STAS domain-containing protein [Erysipelotrichaceae bacterium]|nr:STAS domain-containing protein [Erysipelotrichaceae bacterium]
MEINITHGEQMVVSLNGRLDTVTSVDFTKRMQEEKVEEKLVIIDMTNLEYISSAGLRALLALKKTLALEGKELEVHNLSPICQEVFKVTGFKNILTVK